MAKPRCAHSYGLSDIPCQGRACFDWPVCRVHLKWWARHNLWAMVHARPVAEIAATWVPDGTGADCDLWFLTSPTATAIDRYERRNSRGRVVYLGRRKNAVRCPISTTTAIVVADWYEAHGDHGSATKIRTWLSPGIAVELAARSVQGELFGS